MTRAGYTALPVYYDRWQKSYGKDYSTLIAPRFYATLQRYQVPVSTFADVGCGTGTLTLMLAQRGWKGFGLDASEGMIREARAKVSGSDGHVQFLQQDMRTFTLPGPVRVISALFDVMNHLTRLRDLNATLRAVHRGLLPSGLFIFDTNNEHCFTTIWNKTETIEHRDFTIILHNTYLPARRLARCHVTILPKQDLRAHREQEVVRERCYTRDEMTETLAAAGFRVLEGEDFNFTGGPGVGDLKTWWVAQKSKLHKTFVPHRLVRITHKSERGEHVTQGVEGGARAVTHLDVDGADGAKVHGEPGEAEQRTHGITHECTGRTV